LQMSEETRCTVAFRVVAPITGGGYQAPLRVRSAAAARFAGSCWNRLSLHRPPVAVGRRQ